ncbi:MAG: LacI family DNA-binding transcriptional regulator [Inquilinaceae bacterium]
MGSISLKDLSRHLALSETTVSRALNGYPEVSERTRQRAQAAAKELGYMPNHLARGLALGRCGAVGMVLPLSVGHFDDPFFTEFLIGLGEGLSRFDLDLLVTAAPLGEAEEKAYRRLVEGRRVDGVVLARTRIRDWRVDYLAARGIPFVAHGRTRGADPFPYLDMDGAEAFRLATARLIGLGHRRIALVNSPAEFNFSDLRRAGYARAMAAAGLMADPALMVEGDMTEASGFAAGERLLAGDDRPSAVLCANDPMAIGVLRAAKTAGLAVPADLSVIGYDDLPMAETAEPGLTTLRQPVREAGAALAGMLVEASAGRPAEDLQVIWQPELIVRGSDGPGPFAGAG